MELQCLQSSSLTTIPGICFPRTPFLHGQNLKFPVLKKCPDGRKLKFLDFRAQASGTTNSKSVEAIPKKVDSNDKDLVFVAGATGKVGSRTVRELLKLGFRVRAGVRSAQKAESLVQSVKKMKFDVDIVGESTQPVEKLEIVECDLEKPEQIGPALGNASVVICCIGASEKEIFDVTGPYRIDYQATKNLIDAATVTNIGHFIMVSSLGANKIGFPAVILNLFWGVLLWKRKAEKALIASGLPYTIVRPGGMERPTDAYKETHNITLSLEDTLFGGLVSNLQVAELIAYMAKNRGLSYCKVVEVTAETTAPLTPMGDLLKNIPYQRTPPKESETAIIMKLEPIKPVASVPPSAPPTATEAVQAKVTVATALSPYACYDDLKPPSSPNPIASRPKEIPVVASAPEEGPSPSIEGDNLAANNGKEYPKELNLHLSPFHMYEDLKPPTSPVPLPNC